MTDSSFTLLEVHLGDGDIKVGPFELFGAADESAAAELEAEANTDEADTGADAETGSGVSARSVAGLLLALAALVALAVGVTKLRGENEVPSGIAGDE